MSDRAPAHSVALHVVALSGGKDSTAMALRLHEINPDTAYTYVCTPTGDELPAMFTHWRTLGELLGKPLVPIMRKGGLRTLVHEQRALPNWRMRFCTRMLKIEPYAAWLMQQTAHHSEVMSYVGLRADEPDREGGDYTEIPGVQSAFPLREWGWGLDEVRAYLFSRNVEIPLRTDCARCFFQRLTEWYQLWLDHRDIFEDAALQEAVMGATWRSPGRDTWPASLADLGAAFASGQQPTPRKDDPLRSLQCRVCRT
jgi:hypothetical protein